MKVTFLNFNHASKIFSKKIYSPYHFYLDSLVIPYRSIFNLYIQANVDNTMHASFYCVILRQNDWCIMDHGKSVLLCKLPVIDVIVHPTAPINL